MNRLPHITPDPDAVVEVCVSRGPGTPRMEASRPAAKAARKRMTGDTPGTRIASWFRGNSETGNACFLLMIWEIFRRC